MELKSKFIDLNSTNPLQCCFNFPELDIQQKYILVNLYRDANLSIANLSLLPHWNVHYNTIVDQLKFARFDRFAIEH